MEGSTSCSRSSFLCRCRQVDSARALALTGKDVIPFTHSIYHFYLLGNSIFVEVDGIERDEERRVKRTCIESARVDGMAALVYYCFSAGVANVVTLYDPHNCKRMMTHPDASKLPEASELELQQLAGPKVLSEPMLLPKGVQLVGIRLIFQMKRTADGEIDHFKAQLVAQGYLSILYALIILLTSFHNIYVLCVLIQCVIHIMDVDAAFLNGVLQEGVYIYPTPGYSAITPGMVFRLNNARYGIKQSPR